MTFAALRGPESEMVKMSSGSIPFTQFILPNGRREATSITRPPEILEKANLLLAAGFSFEIEVLTNGFVSMEVLSRAKEITLSHKVCANGPDVPVEVDDLVNEAFTSWEAL